MWYTTQKYRNICMWIRDRKLYDANFSWSKFPKTLLGKYITDNFKKLPNQFLPRCRPVFGHQAKEPSKLSVQYFVLVLNCNVIFHYFFEGHPTARTASNMKDLCCIKVKIIC